MGLFSRKKKDDNLVITLLNFVDGLDIFFKNELVDLIYNKEERKIIIQSKFENKKSGEKSKAILDIEKVNKAELLSETDIIEKQKSVGGRAIVGGVLLGPLGAIVGGISGTGKKKKKGKTKRYIILNYSDGEVISLKVPDLNLNYYRVLTEINNNRGQETNKEL